MKEGTDGFVRADQIDLKSIDEQLERHLNKVLFKHREDHDAPSHNSPHSSSFATATKLKTQRQDWEIDPSNLVIKTVIARGTFGTVHRGIYDGLDVAGKFYFLLLFFRFCGLFFHKRRVLFKNLFFF